MNRSKGHYILDLLLTIAVGIQIYLGTNNTHLALAGVAAILVLVGRESDEI